MTGIKNNIDINYNPNLTYQDEYTSEYISENILEENIIDEENTYIEDLIDKGDSLSNLVDKLPNGLSDVIGEVVDQVKDFIDSELKDEILEEVPKESEWNIIKRPSESDNSNNNSDDSNNNNSDNNDNDENNEETWNEDSIWDDDDLAPIEKETHTKEEVYKKEYIKNLYDLFDDYFINLNNILSNYWNNLLFSMYSKNKDEILFILENILLNKEDVDGNIVHVLDSIVRAEKIRSVKLDYWNNNFNAEETIKHLNQLKVVQELRLRYCDTNKVITKPKTLQDQLSNNILDGLLLTYNKKYDMAYANLYRYLYSSNVLLKDAINTLIQEIKAKEILIERKSE